MRHERGDVFRSGSYPHDASDRPETSFQEEDNFPYANSGGPENNVRINRVSLQDVARERFADLLRVAFPARDDAGVARRCSEVMGVTEKTVRGWLKMEHSAPFDIVFAIGCMVGVFKVMEVMTRGESRHTVLGKIVQGAARVFGR